MSGGARSIALKLREVAHDRRGVAALVVVAALAALIGATGFAIDVGVVLTARQALQANTNAAVLDAAYTWDQTNGTSGNAVIAAQNWNTTHPVPFVSSISANASAICSKTLSANIPTCSSTVPNAVSLTQTGTVPTYFITALGFKSWTVSATAIAVYAGGPPKPLNIMFVLDTTQSMQTTLDDSGCTLPNGFSTTRINCALYGVQTILKELNPTFDSVGLMVFPGMTSSWTPSSSCPSTQNITSYGQYVPVYTTGITYQIIGNALSTDYATITTSATGTVTKLNDESNLVLAVGDFSNKQSNCLQAKGGKGTFYADAISAAQAALPSASSSTAQNVIILLSDGEANQSLGSSDMNATYQATPCASSASCTFGHIVQQCNQAVQNGATATAAGTWVYVIAYDSDTLVYDGNKNTGCPSVTPSATVTANGSFKTTSNSIAMPQDVSYYPWVAAMAAAGVTNCNGCTVTDSSNNNAQIGTISSWTGTSMTLKANAKSKSTGASDSLLITFPNIVYDSPTNVSTTVMKADQWSPCSALQNIASGAPNSPRFFSTNSSCASVKAYTDVATQFQQVLNTLSKGRLVLN